MNWRLIIRITGMLLLIEAGMLALCALIGLLYGETDTAFAWTTLIAGGLGGVLIACGNRSRANMSRKDGYFVVSIVWVVFTLIGMLPFLFSHTLPDVASAFFETMSGFTSTGATVINDCDSQPHSLLMWRSLTQWIGGIGIIFFTIAILPAFGVGEVKLFAAEATGPLHDKVHPRISVAAKWIGTVYLALTALCIITLLLCGMPMFDAFNYSLVTTATGGFGTHSAMLREVFNSPAIEYALIFFMFVSGVNYTLIYYTILKGKLRNCFSDAELRCYLIIVLVAVGLCTLVLTMEKMSGTEATGFTQWLYSTEEAFRESAFTVISLQTTTGLATVDYTTWPTLLMPALLFVMFAGACSGSTSGGFKCVRWSIIFRVARNELRRIIHPRAIIPVRMNENVIPHSVVQTLLAFVALFTGALLVGAFLLALFGIEVPTDIEYCQHCGAVINQEVPHEFNYYEALGLSMASLSNVGPGMGYYGPAHSWAILSPMAKYICAGLMLIGRLEIFPVLLLFTRGFWKKS